MIPVFRPYFDQEEIDAVAEVIRSGWWGMGPKTAEFEAAFAESVAAPYCVGTSSCSAALLLALGSLDLAGRDVITTALTFVSTNHAIVQAGGRPVFADVDRETLTLDPEQVEALVTPQTAAIVVVDYAGHPADLDALTLIARGNGLTLVEDAAHACGATHRGAPVGSIADLTCFSFHAVKNLAMGEGGAITLADGQRDSRLRRLRWLGLSRTTWDRTGSNSYRWDYDLDEIGYKAHLSDIPAAIGLVQLRRLHATNLRRKEIAERYGSGFADLGWLALPVERPYVRSAWHMYVVRVEARDRFIAHLAARGIATSVHYKPNHLYGPYRRYARSLPVTESAWERIVTLPLFPGLTESEIDEVISAVRSFEP